MFDSRNLPDLIPAFKVAFFVLTGITIFQLLGSGLEKSAARSRATVRYRFLFSMFCLAFLGVLAYQATWQLAGFTRPAFVEFMRKYNRRPENAARNISRGRILDRDGRELAVTDQEGRHYPLGAAASHLVGYASYQFGLSGVEAADNAALSGYRLVDATDLELFKKNVLDHSAIQGRDLTLTIDARLQQAAADLLRDRPGAVVAVRPATGEILALVSGPTFDPNHLTAALFDENRADSPVLNRALQGLYPPGSTFKTVLAVLAVERGFHGTFDCPGEGFAPAKGAKPIRDHEYYTYARNGRVWPGHGRIDMRRAFIHSSNVFFAQLGIHLGGGTVFQALQRFLPAERPVLMEGSSSSLAASSARWPDLGPRDLRETAQVSIGQGRLLVSPFHMATICAAVANGGRTYPLHLVAAAGTNGPVEFMTAAAAREVASMMRDVVREGTATGADVPGLSVAGKTGTAQAPSGEDHSWFICFAPLSHPEIALAVLVEHGGYGSRSAVPVATELLKKARDLGIVSGGDPHG